MPIIVGETSDTGEIAEEWDALAAAAGTTPFNRPGWIDSWWGAFGTGRLRILHAREGGRLTGVLPMYELRGTLRSPANPHTPELDVVAADDGAARALITDVLRRKPRRAEISFVPAEGRAARMIAEIGPQHRYRMQTSVVLSSPYIELDASWETFEATLSRDFRANLRRRSRNLDGAGTVSIDMDDGRGDLEGLLEEGFRVEAAGWKGRAGTAIASSAETRRFYTAIAKWASERGWLRLAYLRLDEVAIAFDLSIEDGGTHYLVKTGYDPRWARYSPGSLLRRYMIKDAFERGLRLYEFLGDDNPWKREWTRTCRTRLTIKAFSPTLLGRADYLATTLDDPVTRRLRSALAAVVRR